MLSILVLSELDPSYTDISLDYLKEYEVKDKTAWMEVPHASTVEQEIGHAFLFVSQGSASRSIAG